MVNLNTADTKLWGRDPAARQALAIELIEAFGPIVTRKDVLARLHATGRDRNCVSWLFNDRKFRAGRGQYTLQPVMLDSASSSPSTSASPSSVA